MAPAGVLERLYARRRFGIRPGVDRVRLLLDRLGNPERTFRTIHVVGTNGKGSTSAFLSAILSAAGHGTALFTSPHLIKFSERFRINGKEPDAGLLAARLDTVLSHAPDEATFFEIVTALAALLFSGEQVQLAVIEAGMGGRSDATAALPGMMTVITPISLDHCDYLGTTLTEIAAEKSSIAEPGTPVVMGRQTPTVLDIVQGYCSAVNSPLFRADTDFSASWSRNGCLDYQGIHASLLQLESGIPGRYQAGNASLALAAAETLSDAGIFIPPAAMVAGIAAARWPGRMELVPGHPPLLLDGAHNQAGAEALADALRDYRYRRLLLVAGVMADKDARAIFTPLAPFAAHCFCVSPAVERAMADSTLVTIVAELGVESRACGTVGNGILSARQAAEPDDLILVCGSLFTVGEAKTWLAGHPFEGIRG
jgi:dihydrofolate synthase / folylpolyglutamate synthase